MTAPRGQTRTEPGWARLGDEQLLGLRPADLGLALRGSVLERAVRRLRREFAARGFTFRPHCWLSSSWFSPSGIPGIGIPFFLAHPRLQALELAQMGEVEGGSEAWCLRILRHEAGHAIDTAYRLHRRKSWRATFGAFGDPYEPTYVPRPFDRRFVLHLDQWYAQSHPAEDFAETFAVWFDPASNWRRDYAGWPALAKLEQVDRMMSEIRDLEPPVRSRERCEPVAGLRSTLRSFYARRKRVRSDQRNDFFDGELQALFRPHAKGRPRASEWLRGAAPEIAVRVGRSDALRGALHGALPDARRGDEHAYTLEQVHSGLAARAHELRLTVDEECGDEQLDLAARTVATILIRLRDGYFRVAR